MVTRALVIERDETLRDTLRDALHQRGYASIGVGDFTLARALLQIISHPLVVLVSDGDPCAPDTELLEDVSALPRHAYLLLSTWPNRAPQVFNPYTHRVAPVVAIPCDLDTLADYITDAANHLEEAAVPSVQSHDHLGSDQESGLLV